MISDATRKLQPNNADGPDGLLPIFFCFRKCEKLLIVPLQLIYTDSVLGKIILKLFVMHQRISKLQTIDNMASVVKGIP